jgi:VanZ family protein
MLQKLYKIIFWSGYTAVLVTSMINIGWQLDKIKVGLLVFKLGLDHLLHFLVYFLICMYFLAGQQKGLALFRNHQLRKFIVATVTLATFTEVVQLWVPYRTFNVMDWVANVSGIVLGVVIILYYSRRKIQERRLKIQE